MPLNKADRNPRKTYPELLHDMFGGHIPGADRARCSGDFLSILERTFSQRRFSHEDLHLTCRMAWCYTQWLNSSRPIVRMSQELVEYLLDIDLPDSLEELPPLPWDGFWIVVEGFDLIDPTTGAHGVEGVYVSKDFMLARQEGIGARVARKGEAVTGYLVMGVGETAGGGVRRNAWADDTIHYIGITANNPLRSRVVEYGHGMEKTIRVVLNLLLLWTAQDNPLAVGTETPPVPKSPKKLKRLERQSRSLQKFWRVSLQPGSTHHTRTEERPDWDGPMHLTTVRGHYRCYWVADTQGAAALGEKTSSSGKTLTKVRRFIYPHRAWRRGERPEANTYIAT